MNDKLNKQIASAVKNVESRSLVEKAVVLLLLLSVSVSTGLAFFSESFDVRDGTTVVT